MHVFHHRGTKPTGEVCVPELAKRLGRSIPYAQALIRTGRISGCKTARGWMTTAAAVDKYVAEHRTLDFHG